MGVSASNPSCMPSCKWNLVATTNKITKNIAENAESRNFQISQYDYIKTADWMILEYTALNTASITAAAVVIDGCFLSFICEGYPLVVYLTSPVKVSKRHFYKE